MTVVMHVTSSRFYGGPERQMLGLAESLRDECRTMFVSFAEEGCCREFLDEARHRGFEAVMLQRDTPHLVAAAGELFTLIRQYGADVLCCHGYKADLLGWIAGRRAGIPVVAVARGWTGESCKVRLYEALDRRVLLHMDHVVCVSRGHAERVYRAGVPQDGVTVIHNAVDARRFADPDRSGRERLLKFFPEPPRFLVGAAGRLSPEKGFEVLIDAAAEVIRDDAGVGFVLFGDGPLRIQLQERIARGGLNGNFVLGGFRIDLDRLFPHLDLFVQTSHTEGLPNVVLEAFAAGVPVVATAVGGTPEVVEDPETGYLIPPGDPLAVADRIRRILRSDGAARRSLRDRARARVSDLFTFQRQAAQYMRLFRRLGTSTALEQTPTHDKKTGREFVQA